MTDNVLEPRDGPPLPPNGEVEGPRAGAGWSRECTLSSPTRGETTDSHGPLQRLLAAAVPSVPCMIDLCA